MEYEVERLHSSTKEYGSGFMMLSMNMYAVFVRYLREGKIRAPPAKDLEEMSPTFQSGAKTDRRALQSKFKSWAKRMTLVDDRLVLSSNGKLIVARESCEAIVAAFHFRNPEEHAPLDDIVAEIQKRYTWSRKNFGMDWQIVSSTLSVICDREDCLTKLHDRLYRPAAVESKMYAQSSTGYKRTPLQRGVRQPRDDCSSMEISYGDGRAEASSGDERTEAVGYHLQPTTKAEFLEKLKLRSVADAGAERTDAPSGGESSTSLTDTGMDESYEAEMDSTHRLAGVDSELGQTRVEMWKAIVRDMARNAYKSGMGYHWEKAGSRESELRETENQKEAKEWSSACIDNKSGKDRALMWPWEVGAERDEPAQRRYDRDNTKKVFPVGLYINTSGPTLQSTRTETSPGRIDCAKNFDRPRGESATARNPAGDDGKEEDEDVFILPDNVAPDIVKNEKSCSSEIDEDKYAKMRSSFCAPDGGWPCFLDRPIPANIDPPPAESIPYFHERAGLGLRPQGLIPDPSPKIWRPLHQPAPRRSDRDNTKSVFPVGLFINNSNPLLQSARTETAPGRFDRSENFDRLQGESASAGDDGEEEDEDVYILPDNPDIAKNERQRRNESRDPGRRDEGKYAKIRSSLCTPDGEWPGFLNGPPLANTDAPREASISYFHERAGHPGRIPDPRPKIWRPDPDVMDDDSPVNTGVENTDPASRPSERVWLAANAMQAPVTARSQTTLDRLPRRDPRGVQSAFRIRKLASQQQQHGRIVPLSSLKRRLLAPKLAGSGNEANMARVANTSGKLPLPRKFRFFKIVF